MKYLLILWMAQGNMQAIHVTKEQCFAAIDIFNKAEFFDGQKVGAPIAACLPPDSKFDVEGAKGGKHEVHVTFKRIREKNKNNTSK